MINVHGVLEVAVLCLVVVVILVILGVI